MARTQDRVHDVLVIGGGLVGASLAIALDRIGVDVGLVEATPAGALPEVFDQRSLTFADASLNALTALGVMQALRAPVGDIRRIHVSRRGDFGHVLLRAQEHGRERFGQVVVARDFGMALEAVLAEAQRVTRYRPARFVGTADQAGRPEQRRRIQIALPEGEIELQTRLLVGADGSDSAVRGALHIGQARHDYGQALLVARLRCARAPDGTAFERFGDHGPIALLPRGDGHFGLVLGVAEAEADAIAAVSDAEFLQRAQDAFGWRAGRFLSCGPRSVYPARQIVADALIAERAVLVGNAAQTLHPVGAQGFNLGLRDALMLVELIGRGHDPGDADLLREYAQRRQQDRQRTLAFSDGLARLTSNRGGGMRVLRSAGLLGAQALPGLQAELVGGAMGYRGETPLLCRSAHRSA